MPKPYSGQTNRNYTVEHHADLFYLRLTCMLQVSAFSQAIISHVITKKIIENKTHLRFISMYLPLNEFCIDMPDDGMTKGRNT
jgi:hypothetical protein